MKRLLKGMLAFVLVMSLVACGKQEATKTITKTTKGFAGDVTVTVEFKGEKITKVTAEGLKETEALGGVAIKELPPKIVAANSAEVDAISGATVTSDAIKSAVKAAISEAKGEVAALKFTPGTYKGEAYGNISTLYVDVTVTDTAIEKIEITKQGETPLLYEAARDGVIGQIIEGQTLAVDAVSGASVTSNAIIKAVTNALENSGVDMNALTVAKEKEAVKSEHIEMSADVVVVGGGGAGLVAAIEAAQQGATVIVIEKAPYLGGNLGVFGGIYNTPDEKLQATVEMSENVKTAIETAISAEAVNEDHKIAMAAVKADYEAWQKAGSKGLFDSASWFALQTWNSGDKVANKELVDIMCENAYEGYTWLVDLGVEFKDKITQGAGSLYQRTHGAVKQNGSGFITVYADTLAKFGDQVQIVMETEATKFVMNGDKVVGVDAIATNGNTYTFKANNGVVLATGGFAGNVELRQEYCEGEKWNDLSSNVMTTNLKAITGDGIIMARDINANLIDMDQIQLLHLGNPFNGSTKGIIPYKGRSSDEVIFVNSTGQRFVAEDGRRDVMCNAILQQDGAFYWMINDSKNIDPDDEFINEYIKGGYMVKADTLEELAVLIDVDPAVLVATVDQYNAAVETGVDEFERKLLVATIDQGPYFAGKRVPSAHHTMGGVQIDAETHVLDTNGNIIPGLYAAGEVTGGIHGGNRVGGNAVDDTVVFGRIAGANAAVAK